MSMMMRQEGGFTMVELLVAMAIFSFMLLIITVGFINVVRMNNQAIASNVAQDNARAAMAEMVRGIRDSSGVVTPSVINTPTTTLCLSSASGPQKAYYVTAGVLYKSDGCGTHTNVEALTSSAVQVANFAATLETGGTNIVKPEVQVTITLASNNGTTTGSGASIACGTSPQARAFCSVVTLTSGAVAR